jgi:hypothetical protein
LFIRGHPPVNAASPFGPPLTYEFPSSTGRTELVEVRFSELPVASWQGLPAPDKRRLGIVGRGGTSVVRAGREIDYGWYLMGGKRRENYDDWWRCEIRFTPGLDELFGVTHSKQGISPSPELRAAVESDLEGIARTLNGRVRTAFASLKGSLSDAVRAASVRDPFLPVPPRMRRVVRVPGVRYRIEIAALATADFYRGHLTRDILTVTVNSDHPFFKLMYAPVMNEASDRRFHLECLLLAAARADLEATKSADRAILGRVRRSWADALATFLEQ